VVCGPIMVPRLLLWAGREGGEDGAPYPPQMSSLKRIGPKSVRFLVILWLSKDLTGVQMAIMSSRLGKLSLSMLCPIANRIGKRLDQTTRIHGSIRVPGADHISWHEIARPQVHGYDLLNVVFVNPLRFASIADEKVVRVFDAPRGFVQSAAKLGIAEFGEEEVRTSF